MKAIVAQKGNREYFLAARAFHRKRCLTQMVVDWYTPFEGRIGDALRNSRFSSLSKAFGSSSNEVPRDLVRPVYALGLYIRFYDRFLRSNVQDWDTYNKTDLMFAKRIAQMDLPLHDIFFTYSYTGLEGLIAENARGIFTMLDQIDPGAEERDIIRREELKWPTFVTIPIRDFTRSHERNRMEWKAADTIIVNSEWSRECIVKRGCDPDKIELLPLAYESQTTDVSRERKAPPPLRVLWLGRITLQKGIQYLIEAARLLKKEPVEFYVAGSLGISKNAMHASPRNMKWLGNVSIQNKEELYNKCHVFILPPLSDGFAITQLEAFAHGLPVITTRHCGTVVEEGQTGYIVPARDSEALAQAILRFLRKPCLVEKMGERCRKEVEAYNIDAYADGLINIVKKRLG